MQAGFAKVSITPPIGTRLMGWGRPSERLMTGVHDPLHARVLVVSEGGRDAVIVAMDLCFIGREDSQRMHGIIARELGLLPHQVMLAATHTHAGPDVGSYYEAWNLPPQRDYLAQLDAAVLRGIRMAMADRRPARLRATRGESSLPMNRRPLDEHGRNSGGNSPNPGGPVQRTMPLCLLEDAKGKPICLLFSIATHPVCFSGTQASADYIGVACDRLDHHLGAACSLFLQGCGGDSRPRTLAEGNLWRRNPGEAETLATGQILFDEVKAALPALAPMADGAVRSALVEVQVPMADPLPTREYESAASTGDRVRAAWGRRQLELIKLGAVARQVPLLIHAIGIGPQVQLTAIEGEPLHPYAAAIDRCWPAGVTFPLGYVHGEGVYLVTTPMLAEGGYEPNSFWEYNYPSPLKPGMEAVIEAGLAQLKARLG
jgi:hypothetical protein